MTLAAWPDFAFAFQPDNNSLERDPSDPLEQTDFDQGLPRQRRVFRNAPTTYSCTWYATETEKAIWDGFYEAVKGKMFTMPIYNAGAYITVTAQFVKASVKETRDGGGWVIAAQVQTMDKVAPSEDEYACTLLTYGYDGSLDDFIDLFDTTVQSGFYGAIA